jgi:hypothetical protein
MYERGSTEVQGPRRRLSISSPSACDRGLDEKIEPGKPESECKKRARVTDISRYEYVTLYTRKKCKDIV